MSTYFRVKSRHHCGKDGFQYANKNEKKANGGEDNNSTMNELRQR